MKRRTHSEAGYNLIEVIIATALLATVVLTIVTLFYMGRRNVYAGKEMSLAVSTGTRVMEDISGMSAADFYTAFNITPTTTLGTVNVNTGATRKATLQHNAYTGSILRTTDNIVTSTTDPGGFLQRWRNEVVNNNKFASPTIALVVTPRSPDPITDPLTAGNATVIKIRALIRWEEGMRARQLILDTVKTDRPLPE